MPQRGLFITGTDTGAGKTFVTAALAASLAASGESVVVRKPLLTGIAEASTPASPHDHELLAVASGGSPNEIAPIRFDPPVSPHLAAEQAGVELDVEGIAASTLEAATANDVLLVEGVGGLLVPISRQQSVADLAVALGLPVVIAARPGLGTINHCLLTVEALRQRGLAVQGIVMGPWSATPTAIEQDNLKTVEELTGLPVATIGQVDDLTRESFEAAGAAIPAAEWL
jgi:dethiobiotin synthetase